MTTETVDQVAASAATQAMQRVRVALPATVIAYEHPRATVRVDVRTPYLVFDDEDDAPDPSVAYDEEPPIYDVPVAMFGGAGVGIRFRPRAGDTGVLLVCHRSIDEWLNGQTRPTTPARFTRFDLSDAVFLPGLRSFDAAEAEAPDDAIVFEGGEFRFGGLSATQFLARADRVESRLQAMEGVFNAHVHPTNAPATPTSPTLTPMLGGLPVASDTVKAR